MISPNQCKAARDLLEWKQKDLGEKSSVAVSTIADFERKKSQPIARTMADIQRTFEEAGIEFINDDQKIGAVVLKK